jgi:polar amino acid transport system substrate-binding protein
VPARYRKFRVSRSLRHLFCRHAAPLLLAAMWLGAGPSPAAAQTPAQPEAQINIVPDLWQGEALKPKPDLHGLDRLRFVTDSDYPPFHYFDEEGALTGFNVDMARAICEALSVTCEVRPVSWDDLFTQLDADEADAAIASIRIDAEALAKADMTHRYYATPARFIARKESELRDLRPETVDGLKVAVQRGTGHEAYLKQFFPDAEIVAFESAEEAQMADRQRVG